MKKLSVLLLCLVLVSSATAQDWNPWPSGDDTSDSQQESGSQSEPQQPEKPPLKKAYTAYGKYQADSERFRQIDNRIAQLETQYSTPQYSDNLDLFNEIQRLKQEREKARTQKEQSGEEYREILSANSGENLDLSLSGRSLDLARRNNLAAQQRLSNAQAEYQRNPSPEARSNLENAQREAQEAQREVAEAEQFEAETQKNVDEAYYNDRPLLDGQVWAGFGVILRAYDNYKGIGEATAMFFPDYNDWTKEMRRTLSQTFCGFVSIQNCFESLICGAVLDISAGDAISGNVLFGRGPNGQPLTAGTISAERSLPIVLKGLERERLREIVGENVELIVIGGEVINISEVDTTTLPAAEFRLYKVQYSLTNTNDREMKYNLEFKGQTTREFFSSDKKLSPGQTVPSEDRNIEVYSATKYDEVCMTFNPSLPAGTGSTLIVAPKMVSKLCKPIVEYAGGATSVGNYAKKADEEKKQGAPSGGFI